MKKSSDKDKRKVLSLDETVELLGANPPEDIGSFGLDPLGLQFLALKVGERLASKRGRPTDQSWNIGRKIRMKETTWNSLKEIAKQLEAEDVLVAAGQMGAIALERGLEVLRRESSNTVKAAARPTEYTSFPLHEESEEEARTLCPVVSGRRFW